MSERIALCVEYDGAAFHGWQRQASPLLPTVQSALEKALSAIADTAISISCAGRTDTGVHATGQVIHFDAPIDRGEKAWLMGTNSLLPASVRVQWAKTVDARFHARFSATERRYRYVIHCHAVAPALMRGQLTHSRVPLDAVAMHEAGKALIGEHDFSAFRAAGCQSRTPWRHVSQLQVYRRGNFLVIDIRANAFLQHMVRNIAGSLMAVGRGEQPLHWLAELLSGRDRTKAAATASPAGLYLVSVGYPAEYGLPVTPQGPCFLGDM